ncbi:hypothetical protein [Leifsonia shinshuensis]|uniref:DUF1772 domain-containing protein n=1 Tax=Leifsonia shinshuensis TaxID=150026 RepID=A0A7G6YA28_9MICO|nr:hypothetical protein [Leifsonia shinshuensis]QNE35343.1 hypothetical protein F1C12_09525 [Leifsonia shinshuensis]
MSSLIVAVGLVSVTVGAISGFALMLAVERPQMLRKFGIVDPVRVRQAHLDWIMMGVVLIAVGLAVPGLNPLAAVLIAFGGIVNPASFVPMAFSKAVADTVWFRVISYVSFTALSAGLLIGAVQFFTQL